MLGMRPGSRAGSNMCRAGHAACGVPTSHEGIQGVLLLLPLRCRGSSGARRACGAARSHGRLLPLDQLLQALPLLLQRLLLATQRGSILDLQQGGEGWKELACSCIAPNLPVLVCSCHCGLSACLGVQLPLRLACLSACLLPPSALLPAPDAPPASGPPCPSCRRRQRPRGRLWRFGRKTSRRRRFLQGANLQQVCNLGWGWGARVHELGKQAGVGGGLAASDAGMHTRVPNTGRQSTRPHDRQPCTDRHTRRRSPAAASAASCRPSPPPRAAARWRPCRAGKKETRQEIDLSVF